MSVSVQRVSLGAPEQPSHKINFSLGDTFRETSLFNVPRLVDLRNIRNSTIMSFTGFRTDDRDI